MHARAIYNVLTQSQTGQKGGSNPPTPGKSHPELVSLTGLLWVLRSFWRFTLHYI